MVIKRYRLLITLLLGAVIIAALFTWLGREKPVEVLVSKVSTGPVQETVANTRAGTIEACRRAGISPSIGGQIARLPVKEGDQVEQGQVMMELWNEDIASQYVLATREAKAADALAKQACVRAEVASRESARQAAPSSLAVASSAFFSVPASSSIWLFSKVSGGEAIMASRTWRSISPLEIQCPRQVRLARLSG